MRPKKLGAALVVVAALGAVLASSALAAATTTDVKWYTGASPGTVLPEGEANAKTATAKQTSETVVLAWTVSGTAVELKGTGIVCEGCMIENSGGTALGSGKLKFSGVSVAKPSGCGVSSTITTKALRWKADYMIGSTNYIQFEPSAGTETGWATVELTGASCPIGTAFVPKGNLFVQSVNATGVQAAEQEVESSAFINSTAGGSLHVGTEAATLTGKVNFSIGGTEFGTH